MLNTTTLILFREDLLERYKSLKVKEIKFEHFKIDKEIIATTPIIIFIDSNLTTRFLKNRFGSIKLKTWNTREVKYFSLAFGFKSS